MTRSEAFVAQAAHDYQAYVVLSAAPGMASSQALHFLQMWLEKLCKAYLWLPETLTDDRYNHQVVAKILPKLIQSHWRQVGYDRPPHMPEIRHLCREIDLLHPQVDEAGRRPDNVEYPWTGTGGDVIVPATWKFRVAQQLYTRPGRRLLAAAIQLTQRPSLFIQ